MKTNLTEKALQVHNDNIEKGFWDERKALLEFAKSYDKDGEDKMEKFIGNLIISQILCLSIGEISECVEGLRKGKSFDREKIAIFDMIFEDLHEGVSKTKTNQKVREESFKIMFEKHIKDSPEDEIADTIIRLLDLCGYFGIDIDSHIEYKLMYNKLRDKKHGKEF